MENPYDFEIEGLHDEITELQSHLNTAREIMIPLFRDALSRPLMERCSICGNPNISHMPDCAVVLARQFLARTGPNMHDSS